MEIRPIFSALMRSKIGPFLLGLEMALTLAVLVNGAYVTQQRLAFMDRDTGTDIVNQFGIGFIPLSDMGNVRDVIERDLAELRAMEGIRAVSATNTYPVSGGGWSSSGLSPFSPPPNRSRSVHMYACSSFTHSSRSSPSYLSPFKNATHRALSSSATSSSQCA